MSHFIWLQLTEIGQLSWQWFILTHSKKSLGYQKEKEIENFDNPESLSTEMSSMGQKEDKNRPWKDLSEVPRLRQSPRFRSRPENKEFPQGSNLSDEAIGKQKYYIFERIRPRRLGNQGSADGLWKRQKKYWIRYFILSPIEGAQEISRAKIWFEK